MEKYIENTLFIGKPIIHFPTLDSTNDYAKLLLANSTPKNGTVILADFQTQGRGQQYSHWLSDAGENLLFSVLLYPDFLKAEQQFLLNMAICNGIIEGLKFLIKIPEIKIKWPNDIMISNKKLAGILIENAISGMHIKYSIVGIGLNIFQKTWGNLNTATSLHGYMEDTNFDKWKILESILIGIEHNYYMLMKGDTTTIRKKYLQQLYRYDDAYYNFESKGITFSAKISDILPDGRLQLTEKNTTKIREFIFKEVKFMV